MPWRYGKRNVVTDWQMSHDSTDAGFLFTVIRCDFLQRITKQLHLHIAAQPASALAKPDHVPSRMSWVGCRFAGAA